MNLFSFSVLLWKSWLNQLANVNCNILQINIQMCFMHKNASLQSAQISPQIGDNTNNLYETFQSVSKQYYSTKSALFVCMMTSSQPLITLGKFNITSWPLCSFRYGWSWYSPFSSTRALYSYWQAVIIVSILSVQSHAVCVCWPWGFLETCSSSTRFSFETY